VALFNAHLSCCEDEVSRQREADSFIAFLRDDSLSLAPNLRPDMPMVLAGDFNLVMTKTPLDTLANGSIVYSGFGDDFSPDWDGGPLADALPRHTHRAMTYSWRSDYSDYWPGRLDFVLYTDSLMELVTAFVVDTGTLPSSVLEASGLTANDTYRASDHLPLVVDFRIP
jgi:endonuclease/exonuclease/phosphatase family metal-dependent hydrolase